MNAVSIISGVSLALMCLDAAQAGQTHKTQVVLISFDGDRDNSLWDRSLELSAKTGAKFTYFLSCVNVLSKENKLAYNAPVIGAGKSNVGFAETREDVSARLKNIWRAHLSGQEIASHACGHFDGKDWSAAQWLQDFQSFDTIVADAWKTNGETYEPEGWREFVSHDIAGFRAPYLSTSAGLEQALRQKNFLYDASNVERDSAEPHVKGGIVRYSLPMIEEGPKQRRIVSMDYNLFVRHAGGFERHDEGAAFEQRTYEALTKAFNQQYNGQRHPFQFGLHFVLMNGGAYWKALERLAGEVCSKSDVECITYQEYAARVKADGSLAAAGATAKRKGS